MGSCPSCDADLVGVSCKLRCMRCGYFDSCSDLEPYPTRAKDEPVAAAAPRDLVRAGDERAEARRRQVR
jgi:hypothetical protein